MWLMVGQLSPPAKRQDGLNERTGGAVQIEAGKPCHTMSVPLLGALLC